jgi:hypothetical protein
MQTETVRKPISPFAGLLRSSRAQNRRELRKSGKRDDRHIRRTRSDRHVHHRRRIPRLAAGLSRVQLKAVQRVQSRTPGRRERQSVRPGVASAAAHWVVLSELREQVSHVPGAGGAMNEPRAGHSEKAAGPETCTPALPLKRRTGRTGQLISHHGCRAATLLRGLRRRHPRESRLGPCLSHPGAFLAVVDEVVGDERAAQPRHQRKWRQRR